MNVPRRLSRRALLAGAASTLALGALGPSGCGYDNDGRVIGSPSFDVHAGSELLVDATWLEQRLDSPTLRVIDCSEYRTYQRGHIPGATHLWWQDTIEINNPTYGMLAGLETRRSLMRGAGIEPDSMVVLYDDAGGVYASRVLWMLHATSFQHVRLLDGGRQAWRASGHALTRDPAGVTEGSVDGGHSEDVLAHAHDVEAWLPHGDIAVLDTRTAGERAETWHGALREGMIPGSRWLPRDTLYSEIGSPYLAGREQLRERLAIAGIASHVPEIVVYGLHSTLAALPYVALRAIGVPRVRVYDGSWAEWGAGDRPIAVLG